MSVMTGSTFFAKIFLIFAAVHSATALSSSSWYCHRLVPPFITSYVTPCTFPCLVVSRHEHPHIIVQSEPEGTPCHIPAGLREEAKIGKCRRSVCHQVESYKVLKRKRRFICLIAVAKLIKMRKERKALQQKIWKLQDELARNGYNSGDEEDASSVAGRRSGGAGGFLLENAGNNIVRRSRFENTDFGRSGTRNVPVSGGGSGTSRISRNGGFGSRAENIGGSGMNGNLMGGSAAIENVDFRAMNGEGMPTGFSGDLYSAFRRNVPSGMAGSSSGGVIGMEEVGGLDTRNTGGSITPVTGPGGEDAFGGTGGFR